MPCKPALAAVCLALLASALARPARALTVEAYLDLAQRDDGTGSLDRYMDGLRDGILDYNAAMLSAGVKVFCLPAGRAPLEAAELRTRIDAWLRDPARSESGASFEEYARRTSVGLVALEVLNDLYACPAGR